MDRAIKGLMKQTDKIKEKEKVLLKEDRKNDKLVDKAKKKMKGKC